MQKEVFDLMRFFEGYVRNYRRLNLHQEHNRSMFTRREIDYFANVGEILGYHVFVEDGRPGKNGKRSRPMDLSWWKTDERVDKEHYLPLILHLERENIWEKAEETLEKLFGETEDYFVPQYVIGLMNVEGAKKIGVLNELARSCRKRQSSDALLIYRFWDDNHGLDRVWAYHFTGDKVDERRAVAKVDDSGYWSMQMEEEYETLNEK